MKRFKRSIALLLALVLLMGSIPFNNIKVQAIDLNQIADTGKELLPDDFKDLGDGEEWFIPGDFKGWKFDDATKMSRLTGNLYGFSIVLEGGAYVFKAAANWDNQLNVNGNDKNGSNFEINLEKKSKVNFYVNTDSEKVWLEGVDEDGKPLTSGVIEKGGNTLSLYDKQRTESDWPRLVGTIQKALGGIDWSPETSQLFMYDYYMNNTVYKYEGIVDAGAYELKVICGNAWGAPDYGGDSGNLLVTVPTKSKVTFTINLGEDSPKVSAEVVPLVVDIIEDFKPVGISVNQKEFTFTLSDKVDIVKVDEIEKDLSDMVSISPEVKIASVEISDDGYKLIVELAKDVTLEADVEYTFTIKEGFLVSDDGKLNVGKAVSFMPEEESEKQTEADKFIGLETIDKYVIAGNFQEMAGENGVWKPSSTKTQMTRVAGELYAFSMILPASQDAKLPNNEKSYQFKIVKNGDWDDEGSFADGGGNFNFTLDEESVFTLFINTKTHEIWSNALIKGTKYKNFNLNKLPKLEGEIKPLLGDDKDNSYTLYDYNMDGSEYRLERKLQVTDKTYKAYAVDNKGDKSNEVTLPIVTRDIDVTFKLIDGELTQEFTTYEPKLSIQSPPEYIQKGTEISFATNFTNEFRGSSVVSGVKWSIESPIQGVSISDTGVLSVEKEVADDTEVTVVAEYDYKDGFTEDFNKTYTATATVKVTSVVTNFKINYLRHNKDYDGWNLWIWLDGQEGKGFYGFTQEGDWYRATVSVAEVATRLNFITRKGEWSEQQGGDRVFDLSKGNEIWLVEGDKTVYYDKEEALRDKIFTAAMNSKSRIDFTISGSGNNVDFSKFGVKSNGKTLDTTSVRVGNTNNGYILINGTVEPDENVVLFEETATYTDKTVAMRGILDNYYYAGNDLGFTINNNNASFKVWAPTATNVSLCLYETDGIYNEQGKVTEHTPDNSVAMSRDNRSGVWSASISLPTEYKYYMYRVEFVDGTINYAVDPYAKAVSANGERTAIVDLKDTNPAKWDSTYKPATVAYDTDHVIYELHVRDFSIDPEADFENKGKYLAFTEEGLEDDKGNSIGIDYLKELGITTVHLLPSYDFKTVNELTVDDKDSTNPKFNWGYDPQNYNVPEGSYSTDPRNPEARIREFKAMVQALHEADIRVVMDVVYNHTFEIDNGPFEKIVPNYYYRVDSSLEFTNGSGCGNEVASEHPMVRKYIIDSVKYWAKEYNIDGFRFDLFELIDLETATRLTRELKQEIDPTILIYGEPWKAADSPIGDNGVKKGSQKDKGFAVFNDNIRGAIKGDSDGGGKGFATGKTGEEAKVVEGIKGAIDDFTNSPTETINYVTAHDNLNLWDKIITSQGLNGELNTLFGKILDGSMKDGSSVDEAVAKANPYGNITEDNLFDNETIKRSLLANGMVLTMQGIPFIHAGDEMLRSKYGDHNSYKSPDSVNMIRWENRDKFKPIVDYYQGLLELRKNHPAFRMNTKAAIEDNLVVLKSSDNLIVYALKNHANGDSWKNTIVVYNGNSDSKTLDLTGYTDTDIKAIDTWNVAVDNENAGIESIKTMNASNIEVAGLSMMVLYDVEVEVSNDVADFELSMTEANIQEAEEVNIQVVYKNQAGATLKSGNLQVSSDNEEVAIAEIIDKTNFNKIRITGTGVGSAKITLTVTGKEGTKITKEIIVNVINIESSINLDLVTSKDNPVITVDTGDIDIAEIYADLTLVGGNKYYPISTITKQGSFSIKDYILEGTKAIPITVVDTRGKKYYTELMVEVKKAEDGINWDEAIIYFMLTDRFYDGNEANNFSNNGAFDKDSPGAYHGGDFAGVTKKLDYLKDLGVNTIWITPIVDNTLGDFSTPEEIAKGNSYYSYHGYWATNFKELNPYLGTKEELCTLIDEAHDRDMKIMVDVVLNHAGYYNEEHPLDEEILPMLRDPKINEGEEKQWLVNLPDFETEKQEVREQIIDWQVAWAKLETEKGNSIDYFRVDTVKHVDHETWKQFKTALALENSEFKLIGEIFDGDDKINSYLNNGEMDSALDFSFKNIAEEFVNGNVKSAEDKLKIRNAKLSNTAMLGQFLSSHDEDGFLAKTLNGDKGKMKVATSLQLTAKGQPVIYYGEELGQSGVNNWPLYDNRYDLDWTLVNDDNTMLNHYKTLLKVRNDYTSVFTKGNRSTIAGSDGEGYLVFARTYKTDKMYVALNVTEEEKNITFKSNAEEGTIVTDLYSGVKYTVGENGEITIKLPAMKDGGTSIIPVKIANVEEVFYQVEFNTNGGSLVNAITGIIKGNKIEEPVKPVYPGKAFDGWYKDVNLTNKWDFSMDIVEDNIILYAKWIDIYNPSPGTPTSPPSPSEVDKVEAKEEVKVNKDGNKVDITTKITTNKNGDIIKEVIEITKDKKGDVINESKKVTYESAKDGITINVLTELDKDLKKVKDEAVIKAGFDTKIDGKQALIKSVILPQATQSIIDDLTKSGYISKDTLIEIALPEIEIIKQLNEKSIKTVELDISGIDTEILPIGSIKLPRRLMLVAQRESKDLVIKVSNKDNFAYSWKFNGAALKKAKAKLLDLNLLIEAQVNKNEKVANGININIHNKGKVPSSTSVTLNLGSYDNKATGIKNNQNVYLYIYNEKTGKLDILPNNKYKVDEEGNLVLPLVSGGDYIVLPKVAAKSISTDLISQVSVATKSRTLTISDSSKKSFTIKEVLPAHIVKVTSFKGLESGTAGAKFNFTTSNKKIATVSKTGKIIGKAVGTANITVTVTLDNGSKKNFKVAVKVKK